MSLVQTEHVLVIPTQVFHDLGYFQGFCRDVDRYLDELFSPQHISYRPRSEMEEDPSFKQLIPYCLFRHTDSDGIASIFQYTRGKGQGETRLHSKRSVGIGGHICSLDADQTGDLHPYQEGMRRELDEEVDIQSPYTETCAGLINDDETEVGKVHLGVAHIFDLAEPAVSPREDEILDTGFSPVTDLLDDLQDMETWSQICLEALFGDRDA
jgi:predicted NUDIX family phosphoesterase|tara:strand:+ start:90 stop:722 length:633 start_codon:yes stop_codon:yes gene_type:complete